jgi:anti-anti-sigma factor
VTVRLGEEATPAVAEELFDLAERLDRPELRLDCHNVEFVGAAALAALVKLRRRLGAAGRRLRLCNLTPAVAEVLAMTRLNRLFDIG